MIKISVIVPVYNAEKFVGKCIESVLGQSFTNLELLLINDGSLDDSLDILNYYRQNDERVFVYSQTNSGVSAARNVGIQIASGDFICFLDSDDFIGKNYLENLIAEIRDFDVVFGGYSFYYSNGKTIEKEQRLLPGVYHSVELFPQLIDDGTLSGILFGSVCGNLYRLHTIKHFGVRFKNNIRVNEDGLFNIEFVNKIEKIVVSNEKKYFYRQWKTKTNGDLVFDSSELDKSSFEIAKMCLGCPNFNLQMKRRELSIVFWVSLNVRKTNNNVLNAAKKLRAFCNEYDIKDLYKTLDFNRISKSKKFLIGLLRKRHFLLFVIFVRRVVPILSKIFKH